MFNKILIANRGEIACRVIKTAKKLGIRSVAVYSDADELALHVAMADEAVYIGASPSQESYLNVNRIIDAALKMDAQAIHPGYGFLSENATFATLCADNNLIFIGPSSDAINAMGSKSAAKKIMSGAQVPLIPGYFGEDQDSAVLKKSADEMGYPVLLKASAGGGGKGMRQVWHAKEFEHLLNDAKRESKASFDNDDMLVEKYFTQPRHVEVQVFCDQHGNGVYLFERDCSVQRRHQKIIEEAPAPNLPIGLREKIGATAVRAAQAIDYEGAGTVEFLLDEDGAFYFMEMNTRLQVEHPVTECITGQDLVEWQLRVANGDPLPLKQDELTVSGHAFEARIYAEDPDNDFFPSTGTLKHLIAPIENAHVRVDSGVVQGDDVSAYYDPMIAKLIVWDEDRTKALSRLAKSLAKYSISGVSTNIGFLYNLAVSKPFINAELNTNFIEKNRDALFNNEIDINYNLSLAGLYLMLQKRDALGDAGSPWDQFNAWRMNQPNRYTLMISVNNERNKVDIEKIDEEDNVFNVTVNAVTTTIKAMLKDNILITTVKGYKEKFEFSKFDDGFMLFTSKMAMRFSAAENEEVASFDQEDGEELGKSFIAPMNGTIVEVMVEENAIVVKGDELLILEAMKMQHTISAPIEGIVKEIFYAPGDLVSDGALLVNFEPIESKVD